MSGVVTVIGIGEDGLAGLSQAARDILDSATVIAGAKRHLAMLPEDDTRERRPWSKDLVGDISKLGAAATSETVCVLASGEPLCHGIAIRMIDVLGADAVRVMPHPGAFSLAAARMGWALSDPLLRTVSVHALPFAALRRSATRSAAPSRICCWRCWTGTRPRMIGRLGLRAVCYALDGAEKGMR